jgi:hypothetical protein
MANTVLLTIPLLPAGRSRTVEADRQGDSVRLDSALSKPVRVTGMILPKPDSRFRMCIDYRAVNAITVKDRYPLPHSEDFLNSTHSSC